MINELIEHLLDAPDGQLDASMIKEIKTWDKPPKAIQVLKVMDRCAYCALASDFVMQILQIILDKTIEDEGTTYEEVVKQATWRNE